MGLGGGLGLFWVIDTGGVASMTELVLTAPLVVSSVVDPAILRGGGMGRVFLSPAVASTISICAWLLAPTPAATQFVDQWPTSPHFEHGILDGGGGTG